MTFYIYPSGHPTPSRLRASLDEDYTTQLGAALQDTHTDTVDEGPLRPTQSGSTEYYSYAGSSTETSVDIIPAPGSQEQFDQDVMIYYHGIDDASLASQFLNLDDDEVWPCTDQTVTTKLDSPVSPSSSLSSTSTGDTLEWELEPSSLHLYDMKKFETVIDFDGTVKTTPWPWGDFKYRPPSPPRYLEPEECAMEYQFLEIEKMLREQLTEAMAQEAIRDGRRAMRRRKRIERRERRAEKEMRRRKKLEREDDRPIIFAFNNQAIRGRTIYNA